MAEFMDLAGPAAPVRVYKTPCDPLADLTDSQLYERYRFDRESILFITDLIRDRLSHDTRRGRPLEPELQVIQSLGPSGDDHPSLLGLQLLPATPTNTCNSNEHLSDFVHFPVAVGDVRRVQQQFPRVVGCVDGTHIRIVAPSEHENDYMNRKRFHSLNVQAVCDSTGRLSNVVARWPGCTHDSFVLRQSNLWRAFEGGHCSGFVLGVSAYPARPWLLTPIANPTTAPQRAYNAAHRRTRVAIEQTFGRAKRRFNILHQEVRLRPEKVTLVVGACAMLHNIAIERRQPDFNGPNAVDNQPDEVIYGGNLNTGNAYRDTTLRAELLAIFTLKLLMFR